MLNVFIKNFVNRTICLLLIAVFLSTFTTGMTALAFCLDDQENHVVGKNFYLADCHSASEVDLIISDGHFSILAEENKNNCTDVFLTNAHILNRPSKRISPVSAKVILSYTLPGGPVSFQQQVAGYRSSVLSQYLFSSYHLHAHRTIVLLV